MLTLYNINEKDVDIATPIDLKSIMKLFKESDLIVVY